MHRPLHPSHTYGVMATFQTATTPQRQAKRDLPDDSVLAVGVKAE
jgi:hypothetical protein